MSTTGHDPPRPRTLDELTEPVVVVLDGQRYVFRVGPLATMLRFVVMHAAMVGAADYSTWVFDINRGDVKAKVEQRWATLCQPTPATEPG